MTIFEKFAVFAETLPEDRRIALAELLSGIMAAETDRSLSPEQLAELDRRMADPNPEYADPAEVEAFFARYRAA
jgi:putative addiction module component (TIGR02574 family)